MYDLKSIIENGINFVEKQKYLSFDLFDALLSPLINKFTEQNVLIRRLTIQINRRMPFNFRPLFGISKKIHTKTISDMLSIYSLLHNNHNQKMNLDKARMMYDWLIERKITFDEGVSWGLNFPYTTRFTNASHETPNLFNTLNAANALIDYYDITQDILVETNISKVISFMYNNLGIIYKDDNTAWLRYYPEQKIPTFNVNGLAVSLFARINKTIGKDIIPQTDINKLLALLKSYQNPDGSWFYAASKEGEWIDGFHSGYIIESLAYIKSISNQYDVDDMLTKGVNFYINNLFSKDGTPKYYHNRLYPIESQSCAQAIQTLAKLYLFTKLDTKDLLNQVISHTLHYLYDPSGYFYYKKEKYLTNKNFYMRWSQTPMILALLYAKKCYDALE